MKVLHLIPNLAGGGGRVLINVLKGFLHLNNQVSYSQPLGFFSFGMEGEVQALGVAHFLIPGQKKLEELIEEENYNFVFYHWWKGSPYYKPKNSKAFWVMIGHVPLPMPKGYDYYVCVSRFHQSLQTHLPNNFVELIYNAVDVDYLNSKKEDKDKDFFTIGRVSHLSGTKIDISYLEIVRELEIPNLRCWIFGDGDKIPRLENYVADHQMEKMVKILGEVDHQEVPKWISKMDVSLYASSRFECFPCSILEKMALGVVVVAEPVGGIVEQIVHGESGFISYHSSDLKRYIELLANNPDLLEKVSSASKERAKFFSLEKQQQSYLRILDKYSS